METATETRRRDPCGDDRLIRWGGKALQAGLEGRPQKRYHRPLRLHASNGSRHLNGSRNSLMTKVLRYVRTLAAADGYTAIPIAREVEATVILAQIEAASTPVLLERLEELTRMEHAADGDEDAATYDYATTGDHMAAAEADAREVDIHLERMAIHRTLAVREGQTP